MSSATNRREFVRSPTCRTIQAVAGMNGVFWPSEVCATQRKVGAEYRQRSRSRGPAEMTRMSPRGQGGLAGRTLPPEAHGLRLPRLPSVRAPGLEKLSPGNSANYEVHTEYSAREYVTCSFQLDNVDQLMCALRAAVPRSPVRSRRFWGVGPTRLYAAQVHRTVAHGQPVQRSRLGRTSIPMVDGKLRQLVARLGLWSCHLAWSLVSPLPRPWP